MPARERNEEEQKSVSFPCLLSDLYAEHRIHLSSARRYANFALHILLAPGSLFLVPWSQLLAPCSLISHRTWAGNWRRNHSTCSVERDLMGRTDRFGVEVRERTMWDIRQGVVGADTFIPKHVVIATWKNVSFAGGIDNSLFTVSRQQWFMAYKQENNFDKYLEILLFNNN